MNEIEKIYTNIKSTLDSIETEKFIIGLSGGLDSSVVAALASQINKDVIGLILPTINTPKNVDDAIDLAEMLVIKYKIINIDKVIELFRNILLTYTLKVFANLTARIRMIILYYYANILNGVVLGTSDKSEYIIGYFTKYGDGAADYYPIINLLKTEVRKLAKVTKPSAPRLYDTNHTAERELGLSYEIIDKILIELDTVNDETIIKKYGNDAERIINLIKQNKHKRMKI